ncbi:extracellular solute-binding protein [Bdellovibrio bacteriovorus]|uniref:extracellular solute-binding protein n=1 Tax=Bdellovibrio bacteriovorus TaxID=959 RepID=UPI0035A584AA
MSKFICAALLSLVASVSFAKTDKLVVYSSYDGARLGPIFAPFTQATGIQVEVVNAGSTDLVNRLAAEGANTPADLYLDKDIVYLGQADSKGLLQAFNAPYVTQNIPAHLIDANNRWFLIFYRARVIMYNTNKVNPADLSTYEDLADSKWEGHLCLRTSNNSYNEALGASFVHHLGEERTEKIFAGWVNNLALDPIKGDTDLIHAIASGTCSVGIANTYYLAPLVRDNPSFPVKPFFSNQKDVGAHINGVGIGITKASKNLKEANMLLEYLASKKVQEVVANGFSQYPSNRTAEIAPTLINFGAFVEDTTNVGTIAEKAPKAKELMNKVGYK